jgi:hypothetical protein
MLSIFFRGFGRALSTPLHGSGSISINMRDNLGIEKRPRRFSLPEAFFEGSQLLHDKGEGCG